MKPKAVANAKSEKYKTSRQREREDEAAKAVSENASKARTWCSNFLGTFFESTAFDEEDTAQAAIQDYSKTMGIPTEGHALTDNLGRWCRTCSGYVEQRCDEAEVSTKANGSSNVDTTVAQTPVKQNAHPKGKRLGDMPRIVCKPILKPRGGDLRELVLPGGGDLCLRVWSGIRRYVSSLASWFWKGRTNSPTFHQHVAFLEQFLACETQHSKHAWSMIEGKEKLRTH